MTVLYRYDRHYMDDNDRLTGDVYPRLDEYAVIKRTPKGSWIIVDRKKKLIPDASHRKYAWPTKEEALRHAKSRTVDVIRWLKWYQKCAESFQKNLERCVIDTPERKQKLQHLHKCMMRYENITGRDMQVLKEEMYRKYDIISREQLTDKELDEEITFFVTV